eukprot:6930807-Prymnesium_polylepis.1
MPRCRPWCLQRRSSCRHGRQVGRTLAAHTAVAMSGNAQPIMPHTLQGSAHAVLMTALLPGRWNNVLEWELNLETLVPGQCIGSYE